LLSQIIRLLTNFLIFIGIARLYGPEAFGQFSVAYTFATICIVLSDFGFDVLLTSEIARNSKDALTICRKYFSMKIIFVGLGSLVMISIPSFQYFSQTSRIIIYTFTLYVVFTSFTNFFNAIFKGLERFEYETKISFVTNSTLLILLGLLGFFRIPLFQIVIFFVVVRFVGAALSMMKAFSLTGGNFMMIDFKEWKSIINQILVFGIHFVFGSLFFQLDTLLLGMWKGDHAVGIYQAAFKIMILLLIIPDIAINSLLPVLSRLFVESKEKWETTSRLLSKLLFLLSLPTALILFIYPELIIRIIYGHDLFDDAIPLLRIFSLVILVRFSVESYALMITTSKRQHIRMVIVILATLFSFSANYFAIPAFGELGAAWVSLGINIFVGLAYVIFNKQYFFNWSFTYQTIFPLILGVFLIFLVWKLKVSLFVFAVILMLFILVTYYIGFSSYERRAIFSELVSKSIWLIK
jgi:O-antigen/teichoic acid export membrane protein